MDDNIIISTATAYISDEFHFPQDVGWYSSVYTMVVCTAQLLFGKLIVRYSICWIYILLPWFCSWSDPPSVALHLAPQPSSLAVQSLHWDVPAC